MSAIVRAVVSYFLLYLINIEKCCLLEIPFHMGAVMYIRRISQFTDSNKVFNITVPVKEMKCRVRKEVLCGQGFDYVAVQRRWGESSRQGLSCQGLV